MKDVKREWIAGKTDLVLITGANGFVGTKVFETLLDYGFIRLRCLVRSGRNLERLRDLASSRGVDVEFIQGNLLKRDDCKQAAEGVSIVYHLAAGMEKSFPGCFLNSAVTTRNLLDALVEGSTLKRFVNISSLSVYSNAKIPRGGLLDESCEVDTKFVERHEPYTYGKAKQDEIVLKYAKEHGLPYVFVRPSVVFGPGKAQITGRVGLDTFGVFLHLGLGNRVPLTYVDNCAEAIVLAGLVKGVDGEVFNVFDDDLPKSREFLRMYKRSVRRFTSIPVPYPVFYLFSYAWEKYSMWSEGQLPPVFNRFKCATYYKGNRYSNCKAKELLGWKPRVPMSEGLERFFAYSRERAGRK